MWHFDLTTHQLTAVITVVVLVGLYAAYKAFDA